MSKKKRAEMGTLEKIIRVFTVQSDRSKVIVQCI